MFFKRKESFFLDLDKESGKDTGKEASQAKPAQAASQAAPAPATVEAAQPAPTPAAAVPQAVAPQATAPEPAAAAPQAAKPVLTTAEAIAAELRAAQEARPAPSVTTFAPECLNPANAIASRRRTAGANLAVFKEMVAEMYKN
jgi:hypothetical protein